MKYFLLAFYISSQLALAQGQPDRGDLIYTFAPSAQYNDVKRVLQNNPLLIEYQRYVNRNFGLPSPIKVTFCDCGQENAFYHPGRRSITMCYELMAAAARGTTHMEKQVMIEGVALITLGHQLGHGLIDAYDLPITGKEENAADQFSILSLLDGSPALIGAAVNGGMLNWYKSHTERPNPLKQPYLAGVHAPDLERYYDVLALVIGSRKVAGIEALIGTKEWQLPPSRASGAADEFRQFDGNWHRLLKPYFIQRPPDPSISTIPTDARAQDGYVSIDANRSHVPRAVRLGISIDSPHFIVPPIHGIDFRGLERQFRFEYRVQIDRLGNITDIRVSLSNAPNETDARLAESVRAGLRLMPNLQNGLIPDRTSALLTIDCQ